jgi:ubiquinone/menaquinone biosynthesis C-methylase UbiE
LAFVEILKANPHGKNEGIDLTEEMLAQAKEKAEQTGIKNYRLRIGDAYHLNYPDNAFDVVINNYMFDLLPEEDFAKVLNEFKRVLRPGGRLVMVNMAQCERWHNVVWECIYRINPALMGGCRGVALRSYLESLEFINLQREFISQMTFPSEVVYGLKAQIQ